MELTNPQVDSSEPVMESDGVLDLSSPGPAHLPVVKVRATF